MALNWDISSIPDYEQTCFVGEGEEQRLAGVTQGLIFLTIGVGLGEITEDNADEFYARVSLVEALHGKTLVGKDGPTAITPEDVRAHIGLHTNVSDEKLGAWAGRVARSYVQEAKSRAKRQRERTVLEAAAQQPITRT